MDNGQNPAVFQFGSIGENWDNGVATSAPGIDLWGIAGHLEDPSIPNGALLFNDSLPMILDMPTIGSEPIYGNFSFPQVSSGGGIVTVSKVSNVTLQVTPVNGITYVSIASYETSSGNITSLTEAKITEPTDFNVPAGTTSAVVYAADSSFDETSSSAVNMVTGFVTPAPAPTPTPSPTPKPASAPTSTSTPTLPKATPPSTAPTPTSAPKSTSLPSQSPPTTVPNQTQSSLLQDAIYGVATAVAIVAIVAVVLVLRKSKKGKN